MKDETGGITIKEFIGLKSKMYSFLVDNRELKKAKVANRNVVAAISHNDYKDELWNNKCIRQSINRIQSKDHIIGTSEITKFNCLLLMTKYIFKIMDMMA